MAQMYIDFFEGTCGTMVQEKAKHFQKVNDFYA